MKNWSLNAKLIAIIGVFFFACVAVSVLGANRLNELNNTLAFMVDVTVKRAFVAQDMNRFVNNIVIAEKNFILETEKAGMEAIAAQIDGYKKEYEKVFETAMSIASEEGKANLGKVEATFIEFMRINGQIQGLALADNNVEAIKLSRTSGREARLALEKTLSGLVELNVKRMEAERERADEIYEFSRNLLVMTSVLAMLVGGILAFFVMRSVSRSIDRVIGNLEDGAAQVTGAAQQISSSSEELSQAATEQASSLEETASSVEEMSSMIQKNSENAKKASSLANASHESATRGKDVVQNMIQAINDINASNNEIAEIVKVIAEIGNKTRVINDIVFQTKLLSFNASVEAARAGEHGKGFAVVAEEVGNLAQMSGNAAKDISTMLDSSIQKVERLVATSKDKVGVGTRVASECGGVLDEIVTNVGSVTSMADEIAKASDEQAKGIQEITRAMSQLDQVTQQNAASSEEAASSAEELSGQAESLRNVVRELVTAIKGGDQQVATQGGGTALPPPTTAAPISRTKAGKGKVLHLKTAAGRSPGKRSQTSAPSVDGHPSVEVAMRRAVGMDNIPSEHDARFEEV